MSQHKVTTSLWTAPNLSSNIMYALCACVCVCVSLCACVSSPDTLTHQVEQVQNNHTLCNQKDKNNMTYRSPETTEVSFAVLSVTAKNK